jgi:hypothetical protein
MYRSGSVRPRARGRWLQGSCAAWACACVLGCSGDDGSGSGDDGTAEDGPSPTSADDGGSDPTLQDDGGTVGAGTMGTTEGADGSDAASDDTAGSGSPWSTSLEVGEDVGAFLSVWGESVSEVWAVGGQSSSRPGELTVGTMWRWDGAAWSEEALPEGTPTLNWIYGVDGTLATVGDFGTIMIRAEGDDAWTDYSCATILPLWGVWGAAADDLWIVGGDGFQREPVLCHFDGVEVTAVEYPEPSIETFALFKIWGTSADHVFAVGDAGYILHYDGEAWTEQDSGTTSDLISLWGRGPDEILAVGGRASGVLTRWDGAAWTATDLPDVYGLNGVFMNDAGVATVVGVTGVAGRVAAGESELQLEDPGTLLTLHAAYAPADGPVFAVGGSLEQAPPFQGVILQREP